MFFLSSNGVPWSLAPEATRRFGQFAAAGTPCCHPAAASGDRRPGFGESSLSLVRDIDFILVEPLRLYFLIGLARSSTKVIRRPARLENQVGPALARFTLPSI